MRGKTWRRLATVVGGALVLAAAVASSAIAARDISAQAQPQARSGANSDRPHPRGVVPRRGAHPSRAAAAQVPTLSGDATPSNGAINPQLLLTYHGGPVMHSHTIHAIFWAPPGFSFPAGYQSGVEAYLQDVALDSGKTSSPYGAISQYTDGGGAAQYNVTYGGSVLATDPLPTPDPSCFDGLTCIMDYQLAGEANAVRSAQGWNLGLGDQYVILTPPNVTTCFDEFGDCSDNVYCAYHSYEGSTLNPLIYLHIPFEPADPCHSDGFTVGPMPNGQSDVADDLISHEEREAATDPLLNAWYDSAGYEADDKCIDDYGVLIGQTGGFVGFNQQIGNGVYDTQLEWSNAKHGCYQMGKPAVSSISPGSAPGGATVGITGTNFFAQLGSVPTVLFNGHASPSVTVDSPTHLTVTVPTGSVTGKVTVQAVGGTGISTQTFGLKPEVTSFTGGSGFAGQSITVNGTGFFGVTSVKFNGVAGAFSTVAADGTSLHVVVPAAATTGAITVTTAGGTGASSTNFVVLPHVTGFTPVAAVAGANVTISGTGFSGVPTVDFTGSAGALLVSQTATSLVVHVPPDALIGPLTVTTADGSSASVASFKPTPKITNFDAATYQAGDTVTVTGSNFTANGALTAKLGALVVTPGSVTATSFQFTVPANGLTASVSATNLDGTATSPATLKVRPTITGDPAPNEGKAADHITLTGKTFTGTTSVKFNGTVISLYTVGIGGTTLNVTVPAGAVDGPIAVTNAGGTTSTLNPFKVDPKVTSFSPPAAKGGTNVTVNGTGFGTSPVVHFTGSPLAATLGTHTATSIVATVPLDARNGPITVSTANGDALSAAFKPLIRIDGFDALSYQAGDVVTVNGGNFLATGVNPTAKLGALVIVPGSVTATSFQFTVPDNGLTASVSATNANGSTTSPATLKVKPTITGDPAPNDGVAAAHIILSGKTFTGTTSVKFGDNTEAGSFTVGVGGTTLNVTVPNNATTGKIGITNAGGTTLTANNFTVHPHVTGFTPVAAVAGANVTISGTGFSGVPTVDFTGHAGVGLVSHTATSLVVHVPSDALVGPLTVTTADGSSASVASFKPTPKITGFAAATYQAGDTVTVTGSNFTANGALTAKLGALVVTPGSVTATSFQFTVPANGLTASVSATNLDGTATSPATLKVRPTITGDPAPNEGKAADHITLTGKTFTGTTSVKFGNNTQAAAFVIGGGGTTLNITVPNNAMTGKIGVTNAGGLTQTTLDFTVDPKINSFSPTSGAVGTILTVNGTGFGGADRVNFAGGPVSVPTTVTATSLKVAVPPGATTGTISVRTPAGTSPPSATPFTVTFSVTSISPTSGNYNDDVTINGIGLTGVTAVKFNGIAGAIQPGGTATVLHVHVPAAGAVTGHVTVWKSLVSVQAPQDFTLLGVSSIAPTSAVRGRSVVLTGHGFTGTTSVKFNGATAAFVVDSDTQITTSAPAGATSGTISVTTPAGTATSGSSFTVSRVVINEFSTGTTAHSDDEFVELKNTGSGAADITGCKLVYRGAGDLADTQLAVIPASTTITAGHFYVLGGANYSGTADLSFGPDLDSSSGGLALECGTNDTVNDSVGWGTPPSGFGEGSPLAAPASDQSAARIPDGTDTGDNSSDFAVETTPTPGGDNVGS